MIKNLKHTVLVISLFVGFATVSNRGEASLRCSGLLTAHKAASAGADKLSFEPLDLNYDQILRRPELIASKRQAEVMLNNYEKGILPLPQGLQPHSRKQCLGTCYLYSGQLLIENLLKRRGEIPLKSLLLMGPFFGYLGVERLTQSDGSEQVRDLIHGGLEEAFHIGRNRRLFYLNEAQIKRLGGSGRALDLEADFLNVFVKSETFKYEEKTYTKHLQEKPLTIGRVVSEAFKAYVLIVKKIDIDLNFIQVGDFEYTTALEHNAPLGDPSFFFIRGRGSTKFEKNVAAVRKEMQRAALLSERDTLDGSAYKRIWDQDNSALVKEIVLKLKEGGLVMVSLEEAVFGENHAVVLVNLVVEPQTHKILGFTYLNSHGEGFGVRGYGYIHAAELEKHMISFQMF